MFAFPTTSGATATNSVPSTPGYWLLGADGGVFSYGAPFYGSTAPVCLPPAGLSIDDCAWGGSTSTHRWSTSLRLTHRYQPEESVVAWKKARAYPA